MAFTDPRRAIAKAEQGEMSEFSTIKNLGLIGMISVTGIRLSNYMERQRAAIEENVLRAKTEIERAALIFTDDTNMKLNTKEGTVSRVEYIDTGEGYDPMAEWQALKEKGLSEPAPFTDTMMPAEMSDELYEQAKLVDDLNMRLAGREPMTASEASQSMARYRRLSDRLQKEYPGLQASVESVEGLRITKVTETGTDFLMHVHDGVRHEVINLPKWSSGILSWGGNMYATKQPAQITGNMIQVGGTIENVIKRVAERLRKGTFGRVGKARELRDIIRNQLHVNIGKLVDGHSIKHLLTKEVSFESLAAKFGGKPSEAGSQAREWVASLTDRLSVYAKTGPGLRRLDKIFPGNIPTISLTSSSEASFVKGFNMRTRLPYGVGPLDTRAKASTTRANYIKGKYMFDARMSPTKVASKLGPLPMDAADLLSKEMVEGLPGGFMNMGVYLGKGEIEKLGPGGGVYLLRNLMDPTGQMSEDLLNAREFDGVRERVHRIPITSRQEGMQILRDMKAMIGDKKELILRKGSQIGPIGSPRAVVMDERQKVTYTNIIEDELIIRTEADRPLGLMTKATQSKVMIQRVEMAGTSSELFSSLHPESTLIGKMVQQTKAAQLGAEMLVNMDALMKYQGGGLGWGIIQKTMSDLINLKKAEIARIHKENASKILPTEMKKLEGELKDLLRTFLGADIDNVVHSVGIVQDANRPYIILKGADQMPSGVAATMADPAFYKLIDIEDAFFKASAGDWSKLEEYERRVSTHAKNVGLPQYRMITTVSNVEREMASMVEKSEQFMPTIVRTRLSKGGKVGHKMIWAMAQVPWMTHQQNAYEYARFGGLVRSKGGYSGGFRSTLDHYEIAKTAGWHQYARYLDMLMDHDMDYIRDKMYTAEAMLLGPKASLQKPPIGTINVSGMTVIKQAQLNQTGINKRLAEYNFHEGAMKYAGIWRVHHSNLSGLQGAIDDPEVKHLIDDGIIQFDDLRTTAHAASGRHSVDVTDSALVHDIVDLMKGAKPDEAVFLELPETIVMNGKEVRYIPIDKFDVADTFELEARRGPDGTTLDDYLHKKFTTGSGFHSNRMYIMKETARISEEMRMLKRNRKGTSHLKEEMKIAVSRYYAELDRLLNMKNSPALKAMFSYNMPFSMRGVINSLSKHDAGKLVKGVDGIPVDQMYIHADYATQLISGGKIKSMSHARNLARSTEAILKVQELLKGVDTSFFETSSVDDMAELTVKLGKSLGRMTRETKATMDLQTVKELIGLGYAARKRGSTMLRSMLESKDGRSRMGRLANELKNSSLMKGELDGMAADDLKRVRAMSKYTLETVQAIQEGTLEVGGVMVRAPELSQMSMNYFKMKVLGATEFSQKTVNDKLVKEILSRMKDDKGKGGMYIAKEAAKQISGDQDMDPSGFVVTTLDVLENQSKKVAQLSILKEAKLLGVKGSDIQKALYHDVTEETLVNLTMSRLFQTATDDEGKIILQRPASISAITQMDAMGDLLKEARVDIKGIEQYVGESLLGFYPDPADLKALGLTHVQVRDNVVDKIMKEARKYLGNNARLENLSVIVGTRELPNKSIRKTVEQPSIAVKDPQKLISETPEAAPIVAKQAITADELYVRDAISKVDASEFKAYQERVIREEAPRFQIIKEQVPTGYNAAKALYTLNYSYVTNEADKAFLTWMADKVLAQNVISSKHGTPQVLVDMTKTLRKLGSIHNEVMEADITKLVTQNAYLTVSQAEKEDMARLGFKTEDVNMDLYQDYIDKKLVNLTELNNIHETVTNDMITNASTLRSSEMDIEKVFRSTVDLKVKNSSLLKNYQMLEMDFTPLLVSNELRRAKEAKENVAKFRKKMTMASVLGEPEDVIRQRYITMIGAMREYSFKNRGISVFDDPAVSTFRHMEGGERSALELIKRFVSRESTRTNSADGIVTVRAQNTIEGRLIKLGAVITGRNDINRMIIGGDTLSDRQMRLNYLHSRELRQLRRSYAERIVEESSVFRTGSMFNLIEKKIVQSTDTVAQDMALKRVGKLKGASLLVGLLAGTIIGQSINQIAHGYPVPDLGGIREGLGGEYFENRSGYLGREIEATMGHRPTKITSNRIYENVVNRELGSIGDAEVAAGSTVGVRNLSPYLKGTIIR